MKSIKVKTSKTVKIITDLSYLMDKDLNNNYDRLIKQEVYILEEDLRIPTKYSNVYLDTKIRCQDKIYYTKKRFIQDSEISGNEKELFIPDFGKFNESICNVINQGCLFENGKSDCSTCLLQSDNLRYLKN